MNSQLIPREKSAVVLVDFQVDFTEDKKGALAVPGTGKSYIDTVTAAVNHAISDGLPVFTTQDWHPKNHMSFYSNHDGAQPFDTIEINGRSQIMWPPHCIQGTEGAELLIDKSRFKQVVQKGTDPRFDSYSGFADDGGEKTGLADTLRRDGIDFLFIFGLATDYCVKATVLDGIDAGFRVYLWPDLCRGVAPDTTKDAIETCQTRGACLMEGIFLMS